MTKRELESIALSVSGVIDAVASTTRPGEVTIRVLIAGRPETDVVADVGRALEDQGALGIDYVIEVRE